MNKTPDVAKPCHHHSGCLGLVSGSLFHRGQEAVDAGAGEHAEHGAPEAKSNQLSTLPKHLCSLTSLASHCYTGSPSSCSWLGTVAGVAPEIKIAPLVAELGCHPGKR